MKGPVDDLATFAAQLRIRGLTITPDQVADMTRAMRLVDVSRRDHFYSALRSLAITGPDQRSAFDEEFTRFFEQPPSSPGVSETPSRLASVTGVKPVLQQLDQAPATESSADSGASAVQNIAERDFADLDDDQLAEARRLVMAMRWEPPQFRTRRWDPSGLGRSPDLRATIKNLSRPEGDLMRLEMRTRKSRQRPLVVIADISGSMERYADLFLVFAYSAMRRLETVEVFTFSTELTRITEDLRSRDIQNALSGVSSSVSDWSGGTKIGEALAEWNRRWSRRLARGGPIALILSDGWDCGDPELLGREMGRLARSVSSVLWLNPLAAREDYRPATQGMRAVLPHTDQLLPAASVMDLRDVVRVMDSLASGQPSRRIAASARKLSYV